MLGSSLTAPERPVKLPPELIRAAVLMGYASTARWKTFRDPSVPALGTHPHGQRSRLFLEDLVYMVVLVFMFGCNYVWTVQKDRIEHKCHHYFRFIWLGCFNV